MCAINRERIILLDVKMDNDGHRIAYVNFLSRLFDLERTGSCRRAIFSRLPVLVPMVEQSFGAYVLVALVRFFLGRRTVGFLFRPRPVIDGRALRLHFKYMALRLLKLLPKVQTLTILPFSVEPRLSEISDGWIFDPQLWDLEERQILSAVKIQGELGEQVVSAASGRIVCVALGRQDEAKGFDWFTSLYVDNRVLRGLMLFAFGGKVSDDLTASLSSFSAFGGFVCNRLISDEELLQLYACADLVWCAYSKNYDQASGILGRAVQLGIPVVVRRGSLIHKMCELEGIIHIPIGGEADRLDSLSELPGRESPAISFARTLRMRMASLDRLNMALGFRL